MRKLEQEEGSCNSPRYFLDPRLRLNCDGYVSRLVEKLPSEERSRALRRDTAEMTARIVSCLLANLIKAKDRRVIVSLHKNKKYGDFSQNILISTVHRMDELGWIDFVCGSLKDKMASSIATLSINLTGLGYRTEAKQTVIAKHKGKQVHIETYLPPDIIGHMENEMLEINEFLAEANISWEGSEWDRPDLENRQLQRIFNPVEGLNEENSEKDFIGFGRLYGAFWVGMKKDLRQYIRIDGERPAYLDFCQMNVRLAYFLSGEHPPANEDLYDLTEHLAGYDGSKQWRWAVKEFFNSVWYCTNHTMPNNIFFPCDEKLRPSKKRQNRYVKKTVTYDSVYYAICRKHPKLRKILERRKIGYEMARLESDIMVRILLLLKGKGVTALPIHDGLMVPASRAEQARAVMAQVSQEKLGFAIPVASEILRPQPQEQSIQTIDLSSEVNEFKYLPEEINIPGEEVAKGKKTK